MRIIKRARLVEFWTRHPKSRNALQRWFEITRAAAWRSFLNVKDNFPAADQVRVSSGSNCVVFDIAGNNYRMIAAIHYNRQIVHTLRIFTHAEYNTGQWKIQL